MKLFKKLVIGLAVLTLGGCGTSLKTPIRSPDSLHSHIGNATVALVQATEDGGVHVYCTGVWISANEILTAGHCVEHEEGGDPVGNKVHYIIQKEVEGVGEEPSAVHLGKVSAFEVDHDLAVVKTIASGTPEHEVAELASELPAIGEHIFVVGHPRGLYWSYVEGTIAAYRGVDDTSIGSAVQVNATIWYGNSGGGVFDSSGKLVGICSRLTRVPNMSYFVHIDYAKRFLKDLHEPSPDLSKKE